jgi:hypothetical protein
LAKEVHENEKAPGATGARIREGIDNKAEP